MRLKEYGKIWKERKEYIHQNGLLLTGAEDVSKAKHGAGIWALEGVRSSGLREPHHVNL